MKAKIVSAAFLAGSLLAGNVALADENNYFGILLIPDEDSGEPVPAPILAQIGSPKALGGRVVLTVDEDLEIDDYIARKDNNEHSVNISQCKKQASGITQCSFSGTVDDDPVSGVMKYAFTNNGKAFLGTWSETGENATLPMYGANFPEYLWLEEAAEPNWLRYSHGMFTGSARLNSQSAARSARITLHANREGQWNGIVWIEESKGPLVLSLANCNTEKKRKMTCDQFDAKGEKSRVQLSFNRRGNSFKAKLLDGAKGYTFRAVRESWAQ